MNPLGSVSNVEIPENHMDLAVQTCQWCKYLASPEILRHCGYSPASAEWRKATSLDINLGLLG